MTNKTSYYKHQVVIMIEEGVRYSTNSIGNDLDITIRSEKGIITRVIKQLHKDIALYKDCIEYNIGDKEENIKKIDVYNQAIAYVQERYEQIEIQQKETELLLNTI